MVPVCSFILTFLLLTVTEYEELFRLLKSGVWATASAVRNLMR